ncbi:hypothetical protein BGX34_006957, partial [Mortierella sp. NVP85]
LSMPKIPSKTISLLYIAIIGATSTCFCINLGVLVDFKTNKYALEATLEAALLIITLGHCWRARTPATENRIVDLIVGCTIGFIHLLFAGLCLSSRGPDGTLLTIVGGFNSLIALWIIMVSWIKYQFVRLRLGTVSSNNSSENQLPIPEEPRSSVSSDPPQPPLVHLYQPPLSLSSTPSVDSTLEGSRNDDGLELEELPKYQRRAPAQVATIIDMSNLGTASSEASVHVQQGGGGGEGGQDTMVDIELEEAPAYSPSPALASSVPSSTAQVLATDTTSNPLTPETQPGTTSTHLSVPAPSSTNEPPAYSP